MFSCVFVKYNFDFSSSLKSYIVTINSVRLQVACVRYVVIFRHFFQTGLNRPKGFQEVGVPRFRDNGTGWW